MREENFRKIYHIASIEKISLFVIFVMMIKCANIVKLFNPGPAADRNIYPKLAHNFHQGSGFVFVYG